MRFADYQAGDSGQGVTDLQNNLRSLGYSITADGVFGGETTAAVQHFQDQTGADDLGGVAGPATLVALADALASGWKQSGFYSLPSAAVPTAKKAAGGVAPPSEPFDRTKLALLGAAGLGVAWFFYSKR